MSKGLACSPALAKQRENNIKIKGSYLGLVLKIKAKLQMPNFMVEILCNINHPI